MGAMKDSKESLVPSGERAPRKGACRRGICPASSEARMFFEILKAGCAMWNQGAWRPTGWFKFAREFGI